MVVRTTRSVRASSRPLTGRRRVRPATMALASIAIHAGVAHAQWSVTLLHPEHSGSTDSYVRAVGGGQQVGHLTWDGTIEISQAAIWSGSAASWSSLHPVGAFQSIALGASGSQQVGWVRTPGGPAGDGPFAAGWNSTAASYFPLHPQGALRSEAWATDGVNQGGSAAIFDGSGFRDHASLWQGTPESWVSLHPAAATESSILALADGNQVGTAQVNGMLHASLWHGSAASWVDLNPVGATYSVASATAGPHQGGYAVLGGAARASLWTGTPESHIDLNPSGAITSIVMDIIDGHQVGHATIAGMQRAGLWNGSAQSWVDLSQYLPAGFHHSWATGVWADGGEQHVAGYAINLNTGRHEAVLWSVPGPGSAALLAAVGLVIGGRRRR